jgi:hypothetical protein
MAQQRWRRLDAAHLLPLVRAGVKFVDGVGENQRVITESCGLGAGMKKAAYPSA